MKFITYLVMLGTVGVLELPLLEDGGEGEESMKELHCTYTDDICRTLEQMINDGKVDTGEDKVQRYTIYTCNTNSLLYMPIESS